MTVDKKKQSILFEDVEIGVVSALQKELKALINLSDKCIAIIGPHRTYYKIFLNKNGKEFVVVGHTADTMGIAPMAITLTEMIFEFPNLRYIGMIGIAAGFDSTEQDFGDILVPKAVFNYEMGKYKEDSSKKIIFESDYASFPVEPDPLQKILPILDDEAILASIQEASEIKKDYKIKTHSGNFASGSAVIASQEKVKEIENAISRKYIGLDMEAFAIVAVNQTKYFPYPKMFIIKSISDFANHAKDDKEQSFAREISARAFIEVCSRSLANMPISRILFDDSVTPTNDVSESKANFELYKGLAKEFDDIQIDDLKERVQKKEKIGEALGQMILEKGINKEDISRFFSEGALVGVVIAMYLNPQQEDKKIIFQIYNRLNHPFSRHKVLSTIESFLVRNFFSKPELKLIREILELYLSNADQSLVSKVERVQNILDKQEAIAVYKISNNNLKQNSTLKIVNGDAHFSILDDKRFGKVLGLEGTFEDATDVLVDSSGHIVNEISYTYSNFKDFTIYACVSAKKDNEDMLRQLWISFRNEVIIISKAKGEAEKGYPVVAKNLGDGWKEVTVVMRDCIQTLFGEENIKYVSLVKMRIRGSGKIANIILR